MKRIQIRPVKVQYETGYYLIYFSSEINFRYRTKRTADRFAVKINKYLTGKLMEINHIVSVAYPIYRRLWPVLQHLDGLRVQEQFRAAEKYLDHSITVSRFERDAAHHCLRSMNVILESVSDALCRMETTCRQRKITSDIWQIRSFQNLIRLLEKDINSFEQAFEVARKRGKVIQLFSNKSYKEIR